MSPPINTALDGYYQLERGYYVHAVADGQPLPLVSPLQTDGLVVPVYADRDAAEAKARLLGDAHGLEAAVQPVDPLWDTLRSFALWGYVGVMLDEEYPVYFLNRLADMDRSLPTLAKLIVRQGGCGAGRHLEEGEEEFFGGRGIIKPGDAVLREWRDFSRLDKASVRWMLGNQPLPENVDPWTLGDGPPGRLIYPEGATLLGPYVSDLGAAVLFSGRSWAEYFGLLMGDFRQDGDQVVPTGGVSIRPVTEGVIAFLDEVWDQHGPFVDIGLNPHCHRFRQGYFFKHEIFGWCLRTLSGVFQITENRFVPLAEVEPPKGDEVLRRPEEQAELEGVPSVTRHPLRRVLGKNVAPLSFHDAEELLEQELKDGYPPGPPGDDPDDRQVEAPYIKAPGEAEVEALEGAEPVGFDADDYAFDGFDKITGERLAGMVRGDEGWHGPLLFPDIVAACRWLIHEVLPYDEETRIRGSRLSHGGGVQGSDDPEHEAAVTRDMRKAIEHILTDVLTSGYRPEHSLYLRKLIQDASITLEVTVAGYLSDLAFFGLPESYPLDDGSELDPAAAASSFPGQFERLRRTLPGLGAVNPSLVRDLRRTLSSAFEELSEQSVTILASALQEFRQTGRRPAYDYSGITTKLCKVVERELRGRVFEPWRTRLQAPAGRGALAQMRAAAKRYDDTGEIVLRWLEGGRRGLELGPMRFALKKAGAGNPHPALLELGQRLKQFADGTWLTSSDFEGRLKDVSDRFRNGGVHDAVVTYELCGEAFDQLLSQPDSTLRLLLEATRQVGGGAGS
jgi:hypothetical protein